MIRFAIFSRPEYIYNCSIAYCIQSHTYSIIDKVGGPCTKRFLHIACISKLFELLFLMIIFLNFFYTQHDCAMSPFYSQKSCYFEDPL